MELVQRAHKKKRVRFCFFPYLVPEQLDELEQSEYCKSRESKVWFEDVTTPLSRSEPMRIEIKDFWNFAYNGTWGGRLKIGEGCLQRELFDVYESFVRDKIIGFTETVQYLTLPLTEKELDEFMEKNTTKRSKKIKENEATETGAKTEAIKRISRSSTPTNMSKTRKKSRSPSVERKKGRQVLGKRKQKINSKVKISRIPEESEKNEVTTPQLRGRQITRSKVRELMLGKKRRSRSPKRKKVSSNLKSEKKNSTVRVDSAKDRDGSPDITSSESTDTRSPSPEIVHPQRQRILKNKLAQRKWKMAFHMTTDLQQKLAQVTKARKKGQIKIGKEPPQPTTLRVAMMFYGGPFCEGKKKVRFLYAPERVRRRGKSKYFPPFTRFDKRVPVLKKPENQACLNDKNLQRVEPPVYANRYDYPLARIIPQPGVPERFKRQCCEALQDFVIIKERVTRTRDNRSCLTIVLYRKDDKPTSTWHHVNENMEEYYSLDTWVTSDKQKYDIQRIV